jgi:hypothetical protein
VPRADICIEPLGNWRMSVTLGETHKLEVLNVECDKCGRRGRYHLHRLIALRHRRQAIRLVGRDHGGLPAKAGKQPQRYLRRAVPGFVV